MRRAHRIGQKREVLVETLVLENTIEHAIFDRAKNMSRADHQEAKELEDDAGIIEIIQNAQILPVDSDEDGSLACFAPLSAPQQVFGRPDRHKYHRFGVVDAKAVEKPAKKPRNTRPSNRSNPKDKVGLVRLKHPVIAGSSSGLPLHGGTSQQGLQASSEKVPETSFSIFGTG